MTGAGRPSGAVLDRNLKRLIGRAYVPALPRPEFRRAAGATFLAELERRHAPRGRVLPFALRLAIAALVVAAVGLGVRALVGGAAPSLDELHRGGRVALRDAEGGAWRAADGERGGWALPRLEVATPRATGWTVVDAAGSARFDPGSRAVLTEHRIELEAGGVSLERAESLPRWTVVTEHGELDVGAARLHVRLAGDHAALRVDEGEAWLLLRTARAGATGFLPAGGLPVALAVDRALVLRDGVILDPLAGAEPGRPLGAPADGRLVVEAQPDEPTPPSPRTSAPGKATARFRVLYERDEERPDRPFERFTVGLMPEQTGNEPTFALPVQHESPAGTYDWLDVEPGRYTAFAIAEGRALARVGDFDLVADEALEIEARLVRGGSIRGYVVDAETGNPVPGAHVVSETDTPATGLPFPADAFPIWLPVAERTASDGSFTFEHVSPGMQVVRVTAPGYAPAWVRELDASDGRALDPVTIRLRPGGAVTGVVRSEDGVPVEEADLVIAPYSETGSMLGFAMTETDADGRYLVEDLPPGMALVIRPLDGDAGSADEHDPDAVDPTELKFVVVTAGETVEQDFGGAPVGTRLHGRLVDLAGRPLAEHNLSVNSKQVVNGMPEEWSGTTTDEDGRFEFVGVQPGVVQICVALGMGETVALVDEIDVPPWPELEHDLTLAGGTIEGRVVSADGGEPQRWAFVLAEGLAPDGSLADAFAKDMTDGEGRYSLPFLPPGRYRVTTVPTSGGLAATRVDLELPAAREGQPSVARHDFELGPGGEVVVTVVDAHGAPFQGARVTFLDPAGLEFEFRDPSSSTTDGEGRFRTAGVPVGRWTLRVAPPDASPTLVEIDVVADGENARRVVLPRRESQAGTEGEPR